MSQPEPHAPPGAARRRALHWVGVAYLAAALVAIATGLLLGDRHPLLIAAGADVAATLVVFAFSVAFDNSSFYDPYWSVIPAPIALYWALAPGAEHAVGARQVLVIALIALWGVRLTHNWARGWTGLDHEDWRYVDIRRATGRLYWPASLLGIHLYPTLMVFLGLLPAFVALHAGSHALGWVDGLAVAVTLVGIGFEFFADNTLRRFRLSQPPPEAICEAGLWRYSRHPNYLGEILFWWGLAFFSWAAAGFVWWAWIGAVAMTAMFQFASLPMIEKRMLARRPGYAARQRRVPMLVPWRLRRDLDAPPTG